MLLVFLSFSWWSFVVIQAQFERVQILRPKVFEISIPEQEDIEVFDFRDKISKKSELTEEGTFSKNILKLKDGWRTFSAPFTKLKVGDNILYKTYVENLGLEYPNDDQTFEVKELIGNPFRSSASPVLRAPLPVAQSTTSQKPIPLSTEGSCQPTDTKYNNGKSTCKGKKIFSSSFSRRIRDKYWTISQQFAGPPDYEFVIYVNRSETIRVENQKLKIMPVLSEEIYGSDFVDGDFSLGKNCTGTAGSLECVVRTDGGFILPPVLSSKITTKGKFSFKYGSVEIRAKLPKGDWIYPELYLNSVDEEYGTGYDSGQIRIAFLGGNSDMNKMLQGGVILGDSLAARRYGMKTITKRTDWSSDYHTFKLTWKTDCLVLAVDGNTYGTIYPPSEGFVSLNNNLQLKNAHRWRSGTNLAPFDKEMYISLGVGVGGFNFEDTSDGSKPWRNGARSSMKNFYEAQAKWSSTWGSDSSLDVEYVKVYAL